MPRSGPTYWDILSADPSSNDPYERPPKSLTLFCFVSIVNNYLASFSPWRLEGNQQGQHMAIYSHRPMSSVEYK